MDYTQIGGLIVGVLVALLSWLRVRRYAADDPAYQNGRRRSVRRLLQDLISTVDSDRQETRDEIARIEAMIRKLDTELEMDSGRTSKRLDRIEAALRKQREGEAL